MRSFLDAKAMAKTLRLELKNRKIELGHSECLEVVAKQFGFRDWNTMAAELEETNIRDNFSPKKLNDMPKGWTLFGRETDHYNAGSTVSPGRPEETALYVESKMPVGEQNTPPESSFASITQTCLADQFRGQRVSFSADIQCSEIDGSASIWIRVDDHNGATVAFTDLDHPKIGASVKAATDWVRREIIQDVPDNGATIHFGFYLSGAGRAWANRLAFSMTESVPTLSKTRENLLKKPQNLDLKVA